MKKGLILGPLLILTLSVSTGNAESIPKPSVIADAKIDIDRDGKSDRAILVEGKSSSDVDLYIFNNTDTTPSDISKGAELVRKDFLDQSIDGSISGMEVRKNSLVIKYGWIGRNDTEAELTIVNRGGKYLIGGFSFSYDTATGHGACEINYLTGKGLVSKISEGRVLSKKTLSKTFEPIELSKWTTDSVPANCRPL